MATRTIDLASWETRGRWLAAATIGYNLAEGAVATAFGWSEGSVSLFGFGVDSFVEVASAAVVYWRLSAPPAIERERAAARVISALLIALAVGIALSSIARLGAHAAPDSSLPATVVSLASLGFMGFLWRAKLAAAEALNSKTLALDAACSLACIQLSLVLLAGSAVYALWPACWWADGVAALGLAAMIGREGRYGWRAAGRVAFDGGCCGADR